MWFIDGGTESGLKQLHPSIGERFGVFKSRTDRADAVLFVKGTFLFRFSVKLLSAAG